MTWGCDLVRDQLGVYLDGELGGVQMLRVSEHLASCHECREEAAALTRLADRIRSASRRLSPPGEFDGLAATVISRTRAESAQSWRATFDRAGDDWQWAIVGIGSIAATFVSTALVAAILALGPGPMRADSLAALISNLASPSGLLFVFGAESADSDSSLVQVYNGQPMASRTSTALAMRTGDRGRTEAEVVGELADAVTRGGRVLTLGEMLGPDRAHAEALFDELHRRRAAGARRVLPPAVNVYEVRLVTSTSVSAKGL